MLRKTNKWFRLFLFFLVYLYMAVTTHLLISGGSPQSLPQIVAGVTE